MDVHQDQVGQDQESRDDSIEFADGLLDVSKGTFDGSEDSHPDADGSVEASGDHIAGRVPYKAISIASGSLHTCALLEDHNVKCWGKNSYGQLGLGDNRERGLSSADMGDALPVVDLGTGRTAVAIAAGRYASCAILDNANLKCWGLGSLTGLGTDPPNRGDKTAQMGDNLPPVDLGTGHIAKKVAVGYYDACAVREDGTVRCWGTSSPAVDVPVDGAILDLAGAASIVALFGDHSVGLLEPGTAGPPARIDLGMAMKVSGSRIGPCAVLASGGVRCAQNIPLDTLPDPRATNVTAFQISEGGFGAGILKDGTLRAWRITNTFPSSAVPTSDSTGGNNIKIGGEALALTGGGYDHSCVLLASGEVKCWSWSGVVNSALGVSTVVGSSWSSVDLGSKRN